MVTNITNVMNANTARPARVHSNQSTSTSCRQHVNGLHATCRDHGTRTKIPCPRVERVRPHAFLSNLFGGKKDSSPSPSASELAANNLESDLGEQQDVVLLAENAREDGSKARIVYRNNAKVEASEVEQISKRVGWPARPLPSVDQALKKSYLVGSLHVQVDLEGGESRESLIGVARATSDHVFNATIWDVMVDPDYQGQGLGKALVEQMVKSLLRNKITNITLFADGQVVEFYRQLGFEADIQSIKGMFWYPK